MSAALTPERLAEWREKAEYDAKWWGSAHAGHINAERVLALLDEVERLATALTVEGDYAERLSVNVREAEYRARNAEALVAAKDAEIADLVKTMNAQGAALAECRLLLLLKDAETYTLREKDAESERIEAEPDARFRTSLILAAQRDDAQIEQAKAEAERNAAEARHRALVEAVRGLHVRRADPVYEYDCLEGDCDHAPEDYEGRFPSPDCPVLAEGVCAHCADQTAPNEPWEHMIRPDAYWPCATVRAVLADAISLGWLPPVGDETEDGMANTCTHMSASGIDTAPLGPDKVWRCDHCGLRWTQSRFGAGGDRG